jgi:23S rRNA (adenine2030-N6)-methyltransferase
MNYRHAFHAGNFADVHKHVVLLATLRALLKKDKPLFALDTHAGRGSYDLASDDAKRSNEFRAGFLKLLGHHCPPVVNDYIDCVKQFSPELSHYPGSPALISQTLRAQDRGAFCELNPSEARALHAHFRRQAAMAVHARDGYEALGALLPPKERRGFILIDPPFEQPDEYGRIYESLVDAHQRFPTGTFLIWMPLKADRADVGFLQKLVNSGIRRVWSSQLWVEAKDSPVGLLGSGLVMINPPYQLDQLLIEQLPILAKILSRGQDFESDCRWLVPE